MFLKGRKGFSFRFLFIWGKKNNNFLCYQKFEREKNQSGKNDDILKSV